MATFKRGGMALAMLAAVLLCAGAAAGSDPVVGNQPRKPATEAELQYWLEVMVWGFGFETDEIQSATGLSVEEIKAGLEQFKITPENKPERAKDAPLNMLPWPGGRRVTATQNSAVERARQRDNKVGVITPWDDTSYVVLDMPEVLYVSREGDTQRHVLYCAHYIGDSVWERATPRIKLDPMEWRRTAENILETGREFPKEHRYSSKFTAKFIAFRNAVRMKITLTNESDGTFLGPKQVQNCVMMLKLKDGFTAPDSKDVVENGYHARSSADGKRWFIVAWVPLNTDHGFCPGACWGNPAMPCCHSDPQFGDIASGESQSVYGWFSFYEGEDIQGEFERIEKTGWKGDQWDDQPNWGESGAGYR